MGTEHAARLLGEKLRLLRILDGCKAENTNHPGAADLMSVSCSCHITPRISVGSQQRYRVLSRIESLETRASFRRRSIFLSIYKSTLPTFCKICYDQYSALHEKKHKGSHSFRTWVWSSLALALRLSVRSSSMRMVDHHEVLPNASKVEEMARMMGGPGLDGVELPAQGWCYLTSDLPC